MLKIKLNQEMQDALGRPVKRGNRPPLTLRDIMIDSVLAIERDPRTGGQVPEEEKHKLEKYEAFKRIRNIKDEVELKAEVVTLFKKQISKFQPPLIVGQAHEMIEGKYERVEPFVEETLEEEKERLFLRIAEIDAELNNALTGKQE